MSRWCSWHENRATRSKTWLRVNTGKWDGTSCLSIVGRQQLGFFIFFPVVIFRSLLYTGAKVGGEPSATPSSKLLIRNTNYWNRRSREASPGPAGRSMMAAAGERAGRYSDRAAQPTRARGWERRDQRRGAFPLSLSETLLLRFCYFAALRELHPMSHTTT